MPSKVIKGPDAEKIWAKASEKASEQYGNLKTSDPDKYYAIVMTIYKSMCTKHNCTPKKESDMSMFLNRMELTEAAMPKLDLPRNASGYQLYSVTDDKEIKKRLAPAVKALNAGMKKAAKDIWAVMKKADYDEKEMAKVIGKAWEKHVYPVMKEYRDTGANDTEPRYETAQALIDFVKGHYGISGWTDLGDYI